MRYIMLFILALSAVMAGTYEYRDGDWRIDYNIGTGEMMFENGWFAFNDMIEIDTNRGGPITNGTENCVPRIKVGGVWEEFGSAEHVYTDITERDGFFEIEQNYWNANAGNFTRRFVTTFDSDMYIMVQERFEPITDVFGIEFFYGTCFDFQTWEPTQVYYGKGLVGGNWTGEWTSAGSVEPQDFTTWTTGLPFHVYAKILNNGTYHVRKDATYPTTFDDFDKDPDAYFKFEDNLLGITYDYFQSVMSLGTLNLDDEDVYTQSLFLSFNSHDPKLSPYYVDRQQSRSPQEFYWYGGGKIGGYDKVNGYSYNLHSLASYGAKFASMYWNRPTQDEEYGYLIDRDLYRQSFSTLNQYFIEGEDFTTKYHYMPDNSNQSGPNVNATPETHFETYDIAQLGLYGTTAQMSLLKSVGNYELNADPYTEGLLDDVVQYSYDLITNGSEPTIRPWGDKYLWIVHDWQKASLSPTVWLAEDAPTSISGNIINTSSAAPLTEGSASRLVWIDSGHITTYGYITKNFVLDLSNYRELSFDFYTANISLIDNEYDDIRMRIVDNVGAYVEYYIRNKFVSGLNHIVVDLKNPNAVSGVMDWDNARVWRLTVYDNNLGNFSYNIDNVRLDPIIYQRSYVLNTHLEALLMIWKMNQYGYSVNESLMYNLTDSLVHYLPAFEADINMTANYATFLDYRIWFNETPFNGTQAGDWANSWGVRYHWFSLGHLLQLIDTIQAVDPDYDISSLRGVAQRACRWTNEYDTTDMSTKPANSNLRFWCAFNSAYTLPAIDRYFEQNVNNPVPVYAEDVALARTNVEFDRAYTGWLYKVPGANAIVAEVYGRPSQQAYACTNQVGGVTTYCLGQPVNYWAIRITTHGLYKFVDNDDLKKITALLGDRYYNLRTIETDEGYELQFDARNYGTAVDEQFWVIQMQTENEIIESSDIPIENITEENGWLVVNFSNTTCVNKKVLVDVYCDGDKTYDVTPDKPNVVQNFVYEGVTISVLAVDEDDKCGYEQVKVRTTMDEKACFKIVEDPDIPVGPDGDSTPNGGGGGGGGDTDSGFTGIDEIFESTGMQSTAAKGIFALVMIGLFVVVGGIYAREYGAIGLGLLSVLFFAWIGYIPVWVIILTVIATAISIGVLFKNAVTG